MPFNPSFNLNTDDYVKITRPDGSVIFIKILDVTNVSNGVTTNLTLDVSSYHKTTFVMDWYNCYSFGNGVESNRIRDSFNNQFLTPGVMVSTTFEDYKEERLKNGLIYSGLYNAISNTNNLNQFIQAEKITKNINPVYGSIQKLHTRDTDLITLCEDKVIKILANKDAVFNADGNAQLTANQNVLGQAIPFVGEHGISKNPESFSSHSYRTYFTDKARGTVMRLSRDGLTPISDHGMKDWFNDNLRLSYNIVGSYDNKKDEYNLTMKLIGLPDKTVSFKENVKGWVSFKSFLPDFALSCNGNYYTWKSGRMFVHHLEGDSHGYTNMEYNTFYGIYTPSDITVLFNDEPGIVKTFHTLNYEGSQSQVSELLTYDVYLPGTNTVSATYNNPDHYNLQDKEGWYVESIFTDQKEGSLTEFIEKEGKWFNYIRGTSNIDVAWNGLVTSNNLPIGEGAFQGLGMAMAAPASSGMSGCTDPNATNYDQYAVIDDGSCISVIYGCTDPMATNTCQNNCNTDDGSCVYEGCMDNWTVNGCGLNCNGAMNYDANATTNVNCIYCVFGCTVVNSTNYDPNATCDDGNCIGIVGGCTDQNADNYDPAANTDDGSCLYTIYGCIDPLACNYDGAATDDDGNCYYCADPIADNYDAPNNIGSQGCNGIAGDCNYCQEIEPNAVTFFDTTTATLGWQEGTEQTSSAYQGYGAQGNQSTTWVASVDYYTIEVYDDNNTLLNTINNIGNGQLNSGTINGGGTIGYIATNLTPGQTYNFKVWPTCVGGTSSTSYPTSYTHTVTTTPSPIVGCTNALACNYDPAANTLCGACCIFPSGCADPGYMEWDSVTFPGGTYGTAVPGGLSGIGGQCGDPTACQTQIISGCMTSGYANYDPNANHDCSMVYNGTDDSCCLAIVQGCMDHNPSWDGSVNATSQALASNYDPLATTNMTPGSTPDDCHYSVNGINASCPSTVTTWAPVTNLTGTDHPNAMVSWEFDMSKVSQNNISLINHGELEFVGAGSNNWHNLQNISYTGYQDINASNYTHLGRNNPGLQNVDLTQFVDAGAATINGYTQGTLRLIQRPVYGPKWWFTGAVNYQSGYLSGCVQSSEYTIKIGCADPTAANYDPAVNISDDINGQTSSCIVAVYGCTDPLATNYNPAANVNATSAIDSTDPCTYPSYYFNEFDHTQVNNTSHAQMQSSGACNFGSTIQVRFSGFENYAIQGLNSLDWFNTGAPVNYAMTMDHSSATNNVVHSDKDAFVLWARVTDNQGTVFTSHNVTTDQGWFRVERQGRFNRPAWRTDSQSYAVFGGNMVGGNDHGTTQSDAAKPTNWDGFYFLWCSYSNNQGGGYGKTIPFFLTNFQNSGNAFGSVPAGTKVEMAVFPVIDRSKLPANHPEYMASGGNTAGSRLTVPDGADVSSHHSYAEQDQSTYAAGPPTFPQNILTITFGTHVPATWPNGCGSWEDNN